MTLKQTCARFPSQWEGVTDGGLPFYVRYRFGLLEVYIGKRGETLDALLDSNSPPYFSKELGDQWDGEMSWDAVTAEAGDILRMHA